MSLGFFFIFVFFFKQKTAYEMRISDWSSDVCSSDLCVGAGLRLRLGDGVEHRQADMRRAALAGRDAADHLRAIGQSGFGVEGAGGAGHPLRSEEHTSELQSLMRISYAVFCLKKKNAHQYTNRTESPRPSHITNALSRN